MYSRNSHATIINGKKKLSSDQTHELQEVFQLFDSNQDGHLDYHELKVSMRALGFDSKKSEILNILRDSGNDGLLTLPKFEEVMKERILNRDPVEEVKKAFRLFDDDQTGKISLRNLKRVAKEIGEQVDEEDLQAMIDEFDLDQDGEISEKEFLDIMLGEME